MMSATTFGVKGARLAVAVGATLLLALAAFGVDASPAFASGTVTVSVQGKGDATGSGVDCDESGGPDCSEFYSNIRVCEETICRFESPYVEFTAEPDRDGYAYDGWNGCDTVEGRACGLTVSTNTSVTARFRDAQGPNVGAGYTPVVNEGQTALNAGTYSDNAGGDVTFTASRGTVSKTGTSSGGWNWSMTTDDGPAQGGPVTITGRDSSGNASSTTFTLTVNNVAPTATFTAPQSSYSNKTFLVSMADPSDPSGADRNSLTYAFDCGSGYSSFTSARFAACRSVSAGQTVKAKVRDKDGGETEYTRVVTVSAGPQSQPNGRIAFISARDGNFEVYTMSSADGSRLRRLTHTGVGEANVAYSPDGKKIAYDREGEIWVMNANGTEQTRLTNVSGSDVLPAFSPDGTKIAFQSDRNGVGEIYVMNADGSNPTRLTNNTSLDTEPAYSPNGSQIAFTTSREGADEVYVMNADGTGQTNVVNNPNAGDYDPTYSAFDGARLVFQSKRTGNDELFGMHFGFNQTNLTNNLATDIQPSYAPFSFQFAFTSTRDDGNFEIYKMDDPSGANLTRLTNEPALDVDPSWGGASDSTPPTTIINSGPPSFSNSTSATFGFISGAGETSPAFECQLDNGVFEPCTSTRTYNNLAAGEHTFRVRAIDNSGNEDPTPETRTWTVDLTAPTVTAMTPADGTLGVLEGTNATATFSEPINTTTVSSTTFTLTRQGAASPVPETHSYDAATNTATLNPNADLDSLATHTVVVKGGPGGVRDRAGNPLSLDRTWNFRTGDTRPPDVSLTSPANGATVGSTVQLAANATDTGVMKRVEFLVNGSVVETDLAAPYAVQWSSAGFANGTTVQISARAIDEANNQATSAARTVTIDNQAPAEPTISNRPSDPTNSRSASFTFSSEPGAAFECKLDAAQFAPCSSPQAYSDLTDRQHTFSVRARDAAGNAGDPAIHSWTVDAAGPAIESWTPTGRRVSPRSKPAVTFSEAMNEASVEAKDANGLPTTFTLRKGATVLPATVAYSETATGQYRAVLTPNKRLRPGAKYTATVTTAATDAAGNALAVTKSWKFTIK